MKKESLLNDIFVFAENFQDGILILNCETKKSSYINPAARKMLGVKDLTLPQELFTEDDYEKLKVKGCLSKYFNNQTIRFSIEHCEGSRIWLKLIGEEELNRLEESLNTASELNRSMRKLLMEYDQGSLMISDSNGTILFAGQETAENCGYDKNWYIGKNVSDLEDQKIFYPSAIKKAIETGKEQVVIQSTQQSEKLLVAIGVPIFNKNGTLEQVLSITKDYTQQLNLSSILAKMEFGMDITNEEKSPLNSIITCNEKMLEIKSLIKLIAPTISTVLLLGETGTGKEVMAKAIHSLSGRSEFPFIVVSCGSLSPNIVESELFGYESGSFTGANKEGKMGLLEAANGGTVFLDEIGELPLDQQVKLLHVLQEKSIVRVGGTAQIPLDIRIIAATNRDLRQQVQCGSFREDLYYRLNVVSIHIPPLRERRGDISLLTQYFTKRYNDLHNKNKVFSKTVMKQFYTYDWPGNIRELENSVENLIITSLSNYIDSDVLPAHIRLQADTMAQKVTVKEIAPLAEIIEEAERQLLTMAKETYHTTSEIAEILHVNQSTISRKMNAYGIK